MSQPLVHSSPLVVLSSLLERADFTLKVQELADILWLAVQLNQTSSSTGLEASKRLLPHQESVSPVSNSSSSLSELPTERQPQIGVYAANSELPSLDGSEPFPMLPYRAPAVSALPHKLDIGRALRPLMRKAFSQTTMELDEETTAVQIAEEKLWIPALRPALERWLDLMIVVEETPSFLIWKETILEFQQLMERHGAFRDVRCWRLQVDQTGTLQLFLGKQAGANQRPRSYKELLDPTGRRLILVISDCVSSAWRSGKMKTLLDQWISQNSVSVLQMLPERLWERSALGIGISTQFRSYTPGVSNSRLENNPIPLWLEIDERTQLKLPVVTLEPEPMKYWARVVAGVGQAQTPGVLLDDHLIASHLNLLTELEQHPLTVEARVARFWATASPTARQLAGLMASVPISLPVVRLIQHKLLPESGPVHLAEVLMSGLMRFDGGISNIHPDSLPYDFIPGIRELLIDSTPISRTYNVLEQLSKFLEEKTGTALRGFTAFLAPDSGWDASVYQEIQPFARLPRQVLHRLGGNYAELAEQLSPVEQVFEFADVREEIDKLLVQQRGRSLSLIERDVIQGIWDGLSYQEIGERFMCNLQYLKDTAYDLWSPLSEALQTKVRKSNFRSVMQSYLTRENDVSTEPEVAVSINKLESTLQPFSDRPRVISAKVLEPFTNSGLEMGMYSDNAGEFFSSRPESPDEVEVYDYIQQLARKPSSEAIEDFYRFFFQGNANSQQQARAALRVIVTAPDADSHFKYVINRCFYTIGNLWRLDATRHEALRELIVRVENLPTSANDPVTKRLHRHLRAYIESELYQTLKRQMRLLVEDSEPLPCEADKLLGEDLKRFFFIQETVMTTKDIPASYRNSVRQQQMQVARETRQRISSFIASYRQNPQTPLPNPTLIPDAEIFQSIQIYRPDRPNSFRSEAQKFEQHYRSLRTVGELKREIRDYVLAPLLEVDEKYANNNFTYRFQRMLDSVDIDDDRPTSDIATTILCRQILKHLVVEDIHHPDLSEFQGMVCDVGCQAVTAVLLRIVMFWKRIRSCLEDRFGILFHLHEGDRKSDISWLVQAFEHMNLALVLNAKWLGYLSEP